MRRCFLIYYLIQSCNNCRKDISKGIYKKPQVLAREGLVAHDMQGYDSQPNKATHPGCRN
jgi:hypothetical protein